jgi:hypothetical protein
MDPNYISPNYKGKNPIPGYNYKQKLNCTSTERGDAAERR